jgi:transcriptional regulator with XRE-family HTH domain
VTWVNLNFEEVLWVKPWDTSQPGAVLVGVCGDRIRFARKQQNLTMRQVAKNGGPCPSFQSEVENGRKKTVGAELLKVWAKNLNVPTDFPSGRPPCYHIDRNGCVGLARDVGAWVRKQLYATELSVSDASVWRRLVLRQIARNTNIFTPVSLAYTLNLDLAVLERMEEGRVDIPYAQIRALADLTELPESWLMDGDTTELVVESYRDAIILAHRKGISPKQLLVRINEW